MRVSLSVVVGSSIALVAACSLEPSNPFDPATPVELQAKGSLEGRIVLVHDSVDDDTLIRELSAIRISLVGSAARRVEREGAVLQVPLLDIGVDGGRFFIGDLAPDTYVVVVENVQGFNAPALSPVRLVAGAAVDMGELVYVFDDGQLGPGTISGEVVLDAAAGGQRTVTLFKKVSDRVEAVATQLTSGAFSFENLQFGSYALFAEADGFTSDTRLDLDVGGAEADLNFSFAGEDALRLFPITAVLAPQAAPSVRLDDGVFYVAGDSVPLAVLAFGGVTGMRLSTRSDFLDDAGGELPFVPFAAAHEVALPDREGAITIFAQFETRGEDFTFTSETFTTSIVRDVSPPRVVDATILGVPEDADGTFLAATRSLVVRIDAQDDVSAVDGVGIVTGDTAPADVEDFTGPPGLVRIERPQNAAQDGEATVFIVVEDKAGNRSAVLELPLIVDTTDPDVSLVVDNAVGAGVLTSRVARLTFDESGAATDLPVAMQVRVVGDAFGEILPYGPADVVVNNARGAHGDGVTLEARLFDRVGNEATVSASVALELLGAVTGSVAAEGVPLITPNAAGALVRVVDANNAEVGRATTGATGAFTIGGIPEGTGYAIEVALDGYRAARRAALAIPTPAEGVQNVVDVGAIDVALARGNLAGLARLSDVIGDGGHGGITVALALVSPDGRSVVDVTETDDSGAYFFSGIPATRLGENVRISAARDDYALVAVDSVVVADVVTNVGLISLARNRGDFDICRPAGACDPVQFVNTDAIRIRLRDPTDVVRLHVSVNGGAVQAIDLAADNATPVSIAAAADGNVDVVVQTEKSDGTTSAPLAATVVRDRLAPQSVTVERIAAAIARDARFTNAQFVDVTLRADAGAGLVAPLAVPRFAVADVLPATVPEVVGCAQNGNPCRLALPGANVDAVEEKLHRVHAVSCDQAGNCAGAVSTFVIYDETPPDRAHGTDFSIIADGSVIDASGAIPVVVLPTPFYNGEIRLGRAQSAGGVDIVDENGLTIADVFAFRFSLAQATLDRATLQSFSDPPAADAVRSGADIVVPALPPGGATQTVFAELVDAAGNVADGFDVAVRIDNVPPGLIFAVNGGAATNNLSVPFSVDVPVGAETPERVEISVDGGAAVSFDLPLDGSERITLPATDGTHRVLARAFDAVQNATQSEVSIILDRQGPRVDAVRCTSVSCIDDGVTTIVTNAANAQIDLSVVAADTLTPVTEAVVQVGAGTAVTFPIGAVRPIQLPANTSTTIAVTAKDAVGNLGAAFSRTVLHDSTAPTVTQLLLAGGATRTKDLVVPVHIEASADVVEMRFATSTAFSGAFAPFRGDDFFTLSGVDGDKQVCVQVKDAAGNTANRCATITLDRAAPTGAVALVGSAVQSSLTVGLSLTYPGDTTQVAVAGTALACDSVQTTPYVSATGSPQAASVTLSAGDGVRQIFACFRDGAGNTATASAFVTIDTVAPSATLALDNGAAFTLDTTVTANFLNVSSDVATFKLSAGAINCADPAGYGAFVNNGNAPALAAPDGQKTVLACLKDAAGNFAQLSDTIGLDQTNPTVAFNLAKAAGAAPDAAFTNSLSLVLRVTALAGDTVAIATNETSIDCGTASYTTLAQPLPTSLIVPFTLAEGSDGARTVAVCVKDAAGRTNGTTGTPQSITLDRAPPSVSLSIAGGAAVTKTDSVSVTQTSTPGGDLLRATALFRDLATDCTTQTFSGGFATLPSTVAATLANNSGFNDSGTKFVLGCYQDRAGNIGSAVDDILFDEDRPTFAGRPVCSGCNLIDAAPTLAATRNDPYLGFTNEASLADFDVPFSSGDVDFVLLMATTDDDQVNGDLGDDRVCTQNSQCNAAAGELCIDFPVDDSLAPEPPVVAKRCAVTSPPDAVVAPLLNTQGRITIVAALVDVAGNFSNNRIVYVVRDTVAPTASFALNSGAFTTQQTVFIRDLTISGETHFPTTAKIGSFLASSLVTYADVNARDFNDTTSPFVLADAIPVSLSAGDGTKTVRVLFTDNAGNVATEVTQNTFLDTTPPTDPRFANGAVTITGSGTVSFPALALASSDSGGSGLPASPYVLRGFNSAVGAPAAISCAIVGGGVECTWNGVTAFNAPATMFREGENRVRILARDNAGNVSSEDLVTITKDSIAPVQPDLTVATGDDFATLNWVAGDNTHVGFKVYYHLNNAGFCPSTASGGNYDDLFAFEGASPVTTADVRSFVLTGLPAQQNMCFAVTAIDRAGNESALDVEGAFILPLAIRKIADITNTQLGLTAGASPNSIGAFADRNGLMYVAARNKGLIEFSIANPECYENALTAADFQTCTGLQTAAAEDAHTDPRDIALGGGFAFVADTDGVDVVRIREGAAPDQILTLPLTDCRGVDVEGNVLAASHDGGLRLYSLTNLWAATPTAPATLGNLVRSGDDGLDVDLQGTLAALSYASENGSALNNVLVDVTNPAAPAAAARPCEGGGAHNATIFGSALIGRDLDEGYICDLSSGASVRESISAFTVPSQVQRFVPVGPYMIGASTNDFIAFDISNRADVQLVGRKAIGFSGTASAFRGSLVAYGNRVFVSPHLTSGTPNIEVFEIGGQGVAFSSLGSDPDLIASRSLVQFDDTIMNGGTELVHLGVDDVEIEEVFSGNGNFAHPVEENGMVAIFNTSNFGFDLHRRDETGLSAAIITDGATGHTSTNAVLRWPYLVYVRQNLGTTELKTHRLDTNTATATLALGNGTFDTGARGNLIVYNNFAYIAVPSIGVVRAAVDFQTGALSGATTVQADTNISGIALSGRFAFFWTQTGGNVLKAQPLRADGVWNAGTIVTVDPTAGMSGGFFINPPQFFGGLMLTPTPFGAGLVVETLTYQSTSPFNPIDKNTVFQPTGQSGRGGWILGDRLYMAHEGRAVQIFEIR